MKIINPLILRFKLSFILILFIVLINGINLVSSLNLPDEKEDRLQDKVSDKLFLPKLEYKELINDNLPIIIEFKDEPLVPYRNSVCYSSI